MQKTSFYIINGITAYRLLASPVLVILVFNDQYDLFKWLLGISFFTDLIDGTLARKFKVGSVFGSRLDSVADDLTVIAGVIGLIVFKPGFFKEELIIIIALLALFVIQTALAFYKYKKFTSFHTYGAKLAALMQGIFLILCFFLPEPSYFLFYSMAIVTALELIEEIAMVIYLPVWKTNVHGLYWAIKKEEEVKA